MQPEKQPNTVCLALQNFGGWPQWNNNKKQTIQHYLNENIDIFLTTENNVPGMGFHQHNDYQTNARVVGSDTSSHRTQQKRLQCQPLPTRQSSNPKPQQSCTPGGQHRTRPYWSRSLLLDYIQRKKQSYTQNTCWIPTMQNQE